MNNTDLPPLPPTHTRSPESCAVIKRYLAIASDLSDDQRALLSTHLQTCQECAQEWQLLNAITSRVAQQPGSQPSAQVDQAVMAAIRARAQRQRSRRPLFFSGPLLASGGIGLGLVALVCFFLFAHLQPAFQLPDQLSWNQYVLYYRQTMTDPQGKQYHIQTYHNLATDQINVETTMGDELHVETVKDAHKTLGKDMMHHIAQWDTSAWGSDDALFNLAQLRADLQAGKAHYLGKDRFQGQEVYRIRTAQNDILLLDMSYMPVNILQSTPRQTNVPMYDQIVWLTPTQVPGSMWQMAVPQGYKMGQLPPQPPLE